MTSALHCPRDRRSGGAGFLLLLPWLFLAAPPARAEVSYLVATAVEDGWETHWLQVGADGVELRASAPHLILYADGELWAWRTYRFQVPTCPCPDPGGDLLALDEPVCEEAPGGDALQLVGLTGGTQREVVGIRGARSEGGERQTISLLGMLGPLLLLRVDLNAAGCGIHGTTTSRFVAFHGGLGRAVDLLSADEVGRLQLRERTEAWQALRRDTRTYPVETAADITHSATLADVRDGALLLCHRFTAAACFECSDGLWSTGTRSVNVPVREVPGRLAPFVEIPAAVSSFLVDRADAVPEGRTVAAWVSPVRATPEQLTGLLEAFRSRTALERPPVAGSDPRYGEASGRYESEDGSLTLMTLPDGVSATYTSAFQTEYSVPHLCDCDLWGAQVGAAYFLGEHGTRLEIGDGWAHLSGSAPECCGLGWSGDELVRVGDLPRCTVTADTVKLLDAPEDGRPLRTFVLAGDTVTVLPPWTGANPEVLLVRFRGDVATTYGYLRRDAVDCVFESE